MPFEILRNDITRMKVDVIVNSANPKPVVGGGVDTAIHKAAGPKLLEARCKIGSINTGDAYITKAYDLDAKYVIHTVGPVWQGGMCAEEELLRSCYRNSLELARKNHCESIAFPLISAGIYGYPAQDALRIAIAEIRKFLNEYEMRIYLVVYASEPFQLSSKYDVIASYIDEKYVQDHYEPRRERLRRMQMQDAALDCYVPPVSAPLMEMSDASEEMEMSEARPRSASTFRAEKTGKKAKASRKLEDLMEELDETFSQSLLRLIQQKGMKDPDVYKKANMDRKHFAKIRKNKEYQPNKITALALAFALELNLDETKDFIGRAGFALTHSSKMDIIVEHFIENGNYDIFELNETLFAFNQPLIGG